MDAWARRASRLWLLAVAILVASCGATGQGDGSPAPDADAPQNPGSSQDDSTPSADASSGADAPSTDGSPGSDAPGAGGADAIAPMSTDGQSPGAASAGGGASDPNDASSSVDPNDAGTTVPNGDASDLTCPDLDLESGCHDESPCVVPQGAAGGCVPGATRPVTCGGVPPVDSCATDEDCTLGHHCNRIGSDCNASRQCVEGCTADVDCAAHERCDGRRCLIIPCNEAAAMECEPGTQCNPGSERANALGCEPLSCTGSGYDCPEGWRCAVDSTRKNEHDCESIPCNEPGAIPCPSNTRCASVSDVFACRPLPCTTRADCECGVCIGGGCYHRPGQCSFGLP